MKDPQGPAPGPTAEASPTPEVAGRPAIAAMTARLL